MNKMYRQGCLGFTGAKKWTPAPDKGDGISGFCSTLFTPGK